MLRNIHICKGQLGLVFRRGDLARVLAPGSHWLRARFPKEECLVINTANTRFTHPRFDALVRDELLKPYLEVIELGDRERAIVRLDHRVRWFLGPGRHAFWKDAGVLEVERLDIGPVPFEHASMDAIFTLPESRLHLERIIVESSERVILTRDGQVEVVLDPGQHVYWKDVGKIAMTRVVVQEQYLDIGGQEIMTADKVSLRLNLLVNYRVVDVVKAAVVVENYSQALYRTAQMILRAAVGTRPLDDLLADKHAIGGEIEASLKAHAAGLGLDVISAGVRDIILPGDMKHLLNQVTEAQKRAEADLIRRREETAAARSQANTARLYAQNPTLMRLRELETLEKVMDGTESTFIMGSGDIVKELTATLMSGHKRE